MVIPEAKMRVEWIPTPDDRWDPKKEPLLGNFGEYEQRSRPDINESFYSQAVAGILLDGKMQKKTINNFPNNKGASEKQYDGWMMEVLYGPQKGEYFLPSRGHKTSVSCAGYFNTFPKFPLLEAGRHITAWPYRHQRAPNRLLMSARPMEATGTVTGVSNRDVKIDGYIGGTKKSGNVQIDEDAEFFRMGVPISRAEALKDGHFIRVYPGGPQTIVTSEKAR